MTNNDSTIKGLLLSIVFLLVLIAFRLGPPSIETAHAQASQFDHVTIVAPLFLYQGKQGILLLDKRNGNVWFMPRNGDSFADPEFLLRLPFEQLDRPQR